MAQARTNGQGDSTQGRRLRVAAAPDSAPAAAPTPAPQPAVVAHPQLVKAVRRDRNLISQQAIVLRSVAELLDRNATDESFLALVNMLETRLKCTRVSLGVLEDGAMQVRAVSRQPEPQKASALVRELAEAMFEGALHQDTIQYPLAGDALAVVRAHENLCGMSGATEVVTVPLVANGEVIGALVFERDATRRWSPGVVGLAVRIGSVVAPVVALKLDAQVGLRKVLRARLRSAASGILGPRYLVHKFAAIVLCCCVAAACLIDGDYRVVAEAELQALEMRVVTAPTSGYIEQVETHAGERVSEGDVLLRLDVQDLLLEREKLTNEERTAASKVRAAMAMQDRKELAIAQSQRRQAQAQIDLIQKRIDRAVIHAPTDGVLIAGDLAQRTGSPVERGEVLLEIAPADAHQVYLFVDERDINQIEVGQTGHLSLTSDPSKRHEVQVSKIYPVALARSGNTVFRVEAQILGDMPEIRPGLTGVGKVLVDQRSYFRIYTQRLWDWLRLKSWEYVA